MDFQEIITYCEMQPLHGSLENAMPFVRGRSINIEANTKRFQMNTKCTIISDASCPISNLYFVIFNHYTVCNKIECSRFLNAISIVGVISRKIVCKSNKFIRLQV